MPDNSIVDVPMKDGQIDVPSFLEGKRRALSIADDADSSDS